MKALHIPINEEYEELLNHLLKHTGEKSLRTMFVRALAFLDMAATWRDDGTQIILRNIDGNEEGFDPFLFPGFGDKPCDENTGRN